MIALLLKVFLDNSVCPQLVQAMNGQEFSLPKILECKFIAPHV